MTENRWNHLTAAELRALAAHDAVVLLPIGSTEQHGPHLPTGVDDFLATEVCMRAARVGTARPVVVAPSIWCGLAEYHMGFGGTMTLTLSTLHALLRDICRSILRAGFDRILIVNGHGGNVTALHALVGELSAELGTSIAVTSYFTVGRAVVREILDTQDALMHACEGETSMVMALHPHLVHLEAMTDGPTIGLLFDDVDPVHVPVPFESVSESGVAGNARAATAAKGFALLDGCARELASVIDRL